MRIKMKVENINLYKVIRRNFRKGNYRAIIRGVFRLFLLTYCASISVYHPKVFLFCLVVGGELVSEYLDVLILCVGFISVKMQHIVEYLSGYADFFIRGCVKFSCFLFSVFEQVFLVGRDFSREMCGLMVKLLEVLWVDFYIYQVIGIIVLMVIASRKKGGVLRVFIVLLGKRYFDVIVFMVEGVIRDLLDKPMIELIVSMIKEEQRFRVKRVLEVYYQYLMEVGAWSWGFMMESYFYFDDAYGMLVICSWYWDMLMSTSLYIIIFSANYTLCSIIIDYIDKVIINGGWLDVLIKFLMEITEEIRGVMEDILSGEEGVSLGKKEQVEEENKGKEEECVPVVNASISFGDGTVLDGGGYNPEGDVKVPEGDVKIPEGEVKIPEGDVKIPGEDEGNKGGLECFPIEDGKGFEGDDFSKDDDKDSFGSGGCVVGGKVGYRYYY
jgi:hypothetical protein